MALTSIEIKGSVTPEIAAAIAAAIQRFDADTAPAHASAAPVISPWFRAGLLQATGNDLDTTSPGAVNHSLNT